VTGETGLELGPVESGTEELGVHVLLTPVDSGADGVELEELDGFDEGPVDRGATGDELDELEDFHEELLAPVESGADGVELVVGFTQEEVFLASEQEETIDEETEEAAVTGLGCFRSARFALYVGDLSRLTKQSYNGLLYTLQ
jgi:hypothetical protein